MNKLISDEQIETIRQTLTPFAEGANGRYADMADYPIGGSNILVKDLFRASESIEILDSLPLAPEPVNLLDELRHMTPGGSEFQTAEECLTWLKAKIARHPEPAAQAETESEEVDQIIERFYGAPVSDAVKNNTEAELNNIRGLVRFTLLSRASVKKADGGKIIETAKIISTFVKTHEYPDPNSKTFFELTELFSRLEQSIIDAESRGGQNGNE